MLIVGTLLAAAYTALLAYAIVRDWRRDQDTARSLHPWKPAMTKTNDTPKAKATLELEIHYEGKDANVQLIEQLLQDAVELLADRGHLTGPHELTVVESTFTIAVRPK